MIAASLAPHHRPLYPNSPEGIMARAASNEFGTEEPSPLYGLCPRGLIHICHRMDQLRQEGVGVRGAIR